MRLQSANVSLLLDHESLTATPTDWGYANPTMTELWPALRRSAIESASASSPDIVSFADDCLFFAYIAVNALPEDKSGHAQKKKKKKKKNGGASSSAHDLDDTSSMEPPQSRHVGLIYLHAGPANLQAGEANVAVIIKESMRGHGYAREAVQLVLAWAFDELKFHRVQAAVLDSPFKDRAMRLFIGMGFVHEGTKRRAVYQPKGDGVAGSWIDVTYLAMLDTEWLLRSAWMQTNKAQERPVISVWDEMFTRHAKEREQLLKWEEQQDKLRRSSSAGTLKENARIPPQDLAYLTDDASSSVSGSMPPSPRSNANVIPTQWHEDAEMEDVIPRVDELHEQCGALADIAQLIVGKNGQDMEGASVRPPPLHRVASLLSIPSTRAASDGDPQSPVTVLLSPTSSCPGSPPSTSPSLAPSISSWSDSEIEDQDDWMHDQDPFPSNRTGPAASASSRPRRSGSVSSASSSSSSSDSWSDAPSGVGAGWDVISDTSDHPPSPYADS